MREHEQARALARALVRTGNSLGVHSQALITDMNQPLGRAVGNSLEVLECIELLRGQFHESARPVLDLSIELAARMVVLSGIEKSIEAGRERVRGVHESGAALECFRKNVTAQGGDPAVCDDPARVLPLTANAIRVESRRSGFINRIETEEIGHAIAEAGGGRVRTEDQIDPAVGFLAEAKIGTELNFGDLIGTVYCADSDRGLRAAERIQKAYDVGDEETVQPELIKEVIE
jgi:pyrimidine-nucleoside phosphorylase